MEGKEITKRFTFNWFVNELGEADCGVSSKGYAICRAPRYQEKEKWEEDASLICDALEVEFKTGLTPSQLHSELEKAKEFLNECSRFLNSVQAPVTPAIYLKQEITTFLENSGLNKNLK